MRIPKFLPVWTISFSATVVSAFFACLVGMSAQSLAENDRAADEMQEGRDSPVSPSNLLFVDPKKVSGQRSEFLQELRRADKDKRPLYEKYLPVIGANGVLDGIKTVWPACHSEAHDLGKIIFARIGDIGKSLRICQDGCFSGCMHGLLMEALKQVGQPRPHHLDLVTLRPAIKDLCQKNPAMTSSYSPGDCAHGVGHALMFLAAYEIPQAVKACAEFGMSAMDYYCTTGAYMEYVTERDGEDAATKSFLYPCDTYEYPAACARYKMVHVIRRHYLAGKSPEALQDRCKTLRGTSGSAVFTDSATRMDRRSPQGKSAFGGSAWPERGRRIRVQCTTCRKTSPCIWESESSKLLKKALAPAIAVIPAKAGIHLLQQSWIPACAGMTEKWHLRVFQPTARQAGTA